MNLHQDKVAFRAIINKISKDNLNIEIALEKDYYVTLLLKELSEISKYDIYFKGGTALYKALKSIKRFSEDIDIAINANSFASSNKIKKAVREISSSLISLKKQNNVKDNIHGNIASCSYSYFSMYSFSQFNLINNNIKVETNSFSVTEPYHYLEILPHLYEMSSKEDKIILKEKYNVLPFKIKTINVERIFVDKLVAANSYYLKRDYNNLSKHLFDVVTLFNNGYVNNLLNNKSLFNKMVSLKIKEESNRKNPAIRSFNEITKFDYFIKLSNDLAFIDSFKSMQDNYIFLESDKINIKILFISLLSVLKLIKKL